MLSFEAMLKLCALATLIVTCCAPAFSQSDEWWKMRSSKSSTSQDKYKHKEKIEASYDRFKDMVVLRLEPMTISYGVYLGALASAQGNEYPVHARVVLITFKLYNERWRCLNGCDVTFLVNGERLPLGTAENLDRAIGRGSYPAIETLGVFVKPETFKAIAAAESVEFQAGSDEGALKQEHLAALRDFARRLVPPKE